MAITPNIRYKGHLYKGQLVKITTFTKQFIRDTSFEAFSLNFTVSLIKDTECTVVCLVSRPKLLESRLLWPRARFHVIHVGV